MSGRRHNIGRQIAAARALVGLTQSALAERASISVSTLRRMEANDGVGTGLSDNVLAVRRALEDAGAEFIPENGGGPGVRLKYNRKDVKAINRFEGEGGGVGDDDI